MNWSSDQVTPTPCICSLNNCFVNFSQTRINPKLPYHVPPRWFRYESETNQQPIRFNMDEEFVHPVLPHNQILCLHHFNLSSMCFKSLQSLPNWIQLHMSGTSAICSLFQWINSKNTSFYCSLLLGNFQLELLTVERAIKIYVECHLVPLWEFPPKKPQTCHKLFWNFRAWG